MGRSERGRRGRQGQALRRPPRGHPPQRHPLAAVFRRGCRRVRAGDPRSRGRDHRHRRRLHHGRGDLGVSRGDTDRRRSDRGDGDPARAVGIWCRGAIQAGAEAIKHASEWLTIAWTAQGKDDRIAAASKEFLKMLVSIAIAALSALGPSPTTATRSRSPARCRPADCRRWRWLVVARSAAAREPGRAC